MKLVLTDLMLRDFPHYSFKGILDVRSWGTLFEKYGFKNCTSKTCSFSHDTELNKQQRDKKHICFESDLLEVNSCLGNTYTIGMRQNLFILLYLKFLGIWNFLNIGIYFRCIAFCFNILE